MRRCLDLAKVAAKEGESAVGSVVVMNGKIIGEGYEKSRQLRDVSRHAEVIAILDALKNVESIAGATLFTNVEPCVLCSYVIRHHRIADVVFAKYAGELGGTAAPFTILTADHLKSWGDSPRITLFTAEAY